MATAAVLSSAVLLVVPPALARSILDLRTRIPRTPTLINGSTLSAIPLILAGAAYILLQAMLRPSGGELIKRLMLGSAFLLWGVVQMMPARPLTTELGSVVISLYVLDLALIIRGNLIES